MKESIGWEEIYKKYGAVQTDVLAKVKQAAAIFKDQQFTKILDLGCGTGRHSIFFASEGFEVFATDISKTGIEIAKEKARILW
jgi:2-polyprenyl-3-methyl-5-hydroxy-6-metoxy-1,4-benzoquinol methylase